MKPPALRATLAAVLAAFAAHPQAALDVAGLDHSIDACTDFYQFANRSWLQATAIPGDRPRWGTSEIIGERNEKVLLGAIERDPVWNEVRETAEFRALAAEARLFAAREWAAVDELRRQGKIPRRPATQ